MAYRQNHEDGSQVKVDQVYDGVPFETEGATMRIACCACGLSHDFAIVKRRKKRGYRITVVRNNRATAALRRYNRYGYVGRKCGKKNQGQS